MKVKAFHINHELVSLPNIDLLQATKLMNSTLNNIDWTYNCTFDIEIIYNNDDRYYYSNYSNSWLKVKD